MSILTEDMKRVVSEQRLGYVATVNADGTPNLSARGTMAVWDDDHLVFADICSPGTTKNVSARPTIEIAVADPLLRKGYRFAGTCTVVHGGDQLDSIRTFYLANGVTNRIRAAVLVRVTSVRPLVSPAYQPGITEDEVRRRWWSRALRLERSRRKGEKFKAEGRR